MLNFWGVVHFFLSGSSLMLSHTYKIRLCKIYVVFWNSRNVRRFNLESPFQPKNVVSWLVLHKEFTYLLQNETMNATKRIIKPQTRNLFANTFWRILATKPICSQQLYHSCFSFAAFMPPHASTLAVQTRGAISSMLWGLLPHFIITIIQNAGLDQEVF